MTKEKLVEKTPMLDYNLEHIMSYRVTLNPPDLFGPVPEGIRLNYYIAGS